MEIVRLSTKGQLVIPAELRRQLNITPGTYIRIEEHDGHLQLTPLGDDIIEATCGMLAHLGPMTPALLEERSRDLEREEREAGCPPRRK
jgi:AbrB family looped-hinge helix DNA binding protein